jgi:rSAM/selenodomain-associated transferase 2
MKISVIIPVLNESAIIGNTLARIRENSSSRYIEEIIMVDGGSEDGTPEIAVKFGVRVIASEKGRAKQLNKGAQEANGEILYFLHADTVPPKDFDQSILEAVGVGHRVGCFQMRFDSQSRFLGFFAWFTRVNVRLCRGGDQSLFITKTLFNQSGGYNEDYLIFEDNEFIGRLYGMVAFKILPRHVKTSARRYEKRGKVRLQYYFGMIHLKNYLGAGPQQLYDYYRRKILI